MKRVLGGVAREMVDLLVMVVESLVMKCVRPRYLHNATRISEREERREKKERKVFAAPGGVSTMR